MSKRSMAVPASPDDALRAFLHACAKLSTRSACDHEVEDALDNVANLCDREADVNELVDRADLSILPVPASRVGIVRDGIKTLLLMYAPADMGRVYTAMDIADGMLTPLFDMVTAIASSADTNDADLLEDWMCGTMFACLCEDYRSSGIISTIVPEDQVTRLARLLATRDGVMAVPFDMLRLLCTLDRIGFHTYMLVVEGFLHGITAVMDSRAEPMVLVDVARLVGDVMRHCGHVHTFTETQLRALHATLAAIAHHGHEGPSDFMSALALGSLQDDPGDTHLPNVFPDWDDFRDIYVNDRWTRQTF